MRDLLRLFEFIEKSADSVEIFGRGCVDEVRLAAHDEDWTAGMVLAPRGKTRCDKLGSSSIDCFPALEDLGAEPSFRLGKCEADELCVDEIADFKKGSGTYAVFECDDAIFNTPVCSNEYREGPDIAQLNEA